jgi:hypothetical protein
VRARLGLLALAVAVLPACGGGGGGTELVAQTQANLGKIRSGDLHLAFVVTPRGQGAQRIGFGLDGPFSLAASPRLPLARLAYTQMLGARSATATFLSDGRHAYALVHGRAYTLPDARAAALRSITGSGSGGLSQIDVSHWLRNAHSTDCGSIASGSDVECVTGNLDVVRATEDLLGLVRRMGRNVPATLPPDSQKRLAASVRSSRLEIATGKHDRLLRALRLDVDFGLQVPDPLSRVLGPLVGGKVHFELGFARPNSAVHVSPPANPQPYSSLPHG